MILTKPMDQLSTLSRVVAPLDLENSVQTGVLKTPFDSSDRPKLG